MQTNAIGKFTKCKDLENFEIYMYGVEIIFKWRNFEKFSKNKYEKFPKIFQKQKDENVLKIFPKSPNQKIWKLKSFKLRNFNQKVSKSKNVVISLDSVTCKIFIV